MPIDFLGMSKAKQITALYVAYFDRAPDPAGLDFWINEYDNAIAAGESLQSIIDSISESFRLSTESREEHSVLSPENAQNADDAAIDSFITGVYQSLFNRDPEQEGLEFWRGEFNDRLDQGIFVGDFLVDIISGAQGEDATIVQNKIQQGVDFAQAVPDNERFPADEDAILDDVTADDSSVRDIARLESAGSSAETETVNFRLDFDEPLDAPTTITFTPEGAPGLGGERNFGVSAGTDSTTLPVVVSGVAQGTPIGIDIQDAGNTFVYNGDLTIAAPGGDGGPTGPQDVAVADTSADEGNALTFDVTTTNVADGAQVAWSLDLSGTAGDADINAATSGTVAVANNAATITIPTVQDVVNEGDSEALSLTVTSPDGTATASATGTIDDDDMDASDPNSTVGDLAVADASAVEGNDLGFRITSDELAPDAVVDWTIETLGASESDLAGPLSGTAVLGDDGAVTVDVSTVDDDIVESSENLRFAVAHTESGARDVARGSIADNDEPEPTDTFDLTTASATEGDDLEFIFTAPSASDSPRTFDWTVTRVFGGLEDSSLDTDQGQFTLPAGARETTVTVPTSDDTLNTTTTDVPLEITDPSSGDVVASNTGTIADDETAFQNEPFATISSAEATEGDNLVFDIALDRPAEDGDGLTLGVGNINFDIDDTANGVTPDDFTDLGSSDTVAFDDGQTTGQAVLETKDDDIVEGDETFDVSVSSLTVGSNDTNLTGTILDNDGMS